MSETVTYEKRVIDPITRTEYDINGYTDGNGEFLHYVLWVNSDVDYTFTDESVMLDFLRGHIQSQRELSKIWHSQ